MNKFILKAGIVLLIANCVVPTVSIAQKEANIWYFGVDAGLDFNPGAPVALTNGVMNQWEGCASIADANGNLLFYTDGERIWNKNHLQMPNGFGLKGYMSSSQSALIVPKPGSANIYYVFTTWQGLGANYSEVDMTLQGNLGDVTTKNNLLFSTSDEKLTAVKHSNGTDVWVVYHKRTTDEFNAFLVTSSGVASSPVLSTGTVIAIQAMGCMKVSPDGKKLAAAFMTPEKYELLDFDNTTGMVSNPVVIPCPVSSGSLPYYSYGVEFSPDGSKLYVSADNCKNLYQYDVNAGSAASIIASAKVVGTTASSSISQLQLGPDKKLYACRFGDGYLGVVNDPNAMGTACNYVDKGVALGGKNNTMGLPGFIQSYFYGCAKPLADAGQDTSICKGNGVTISATGGGNYLWSTGEATASISVTPSGTTIYSVIVSQSGCADSDTIVVNVNDPPVVDAGANVNIHIGSSTTLSTTGTGSYSWFPSSGLNCTDCQNPNANPDSSTTYYVTVTDANGCSSTDSVTVFVDETICGDVFIPNAFSPNSDGQNDVLFVRGNCIKNFSFTIYNRWGEKVFENTDLAKGWDGSTALTASGSTLPATSKVRDTAIFSYYFSATLSNNDQVTQRGNISLIQ